MKLAAKDDRDTAPEGGHRKVKVMKHNEMIRNRRPVGAILAVLAILGSSALAGMLAPAPALAENVDLRGEAAKDGVVVIENIAGSITVTGWDKGEITVTGTTGKDVERIDFETGRKSRIKVVYPKKSKNIKEGANLEIHVPKGSRLEIECISADISVEGVKGEIEASSISGDVTITGECKEIDAESISGDVVVDGGAPETNLDCVSGSLKARGGSAEVDAETVSGDIELDFEEYTGLSVGSVAGSAVVKGALDKDASVEIEMHSGDVTLILPGNVSADFEIETFSGDIKDAFGHEAHKTSKYAPGKELDFETGGGSARVRISTFSGDVIIKKK